MGQMAICGNIASDDGFTVTQLEICFSYPKRKITIVCNKGYKDQFIIGNLYH